MLHKVEIIQKAWPPSVRSTGIYIDIKYLCSNLHFQSLCNHSLVYPNNFLLKQVSALFPRLREAGSGRWLTHVEALGQTQRTVSGKSFRGGGVLWNLLFLKTLKTDWIPTEMLCLWRTEKVVPDLLALLKYIHPRRNWAQVERDAWGNCLQNVFLEMYFPWPCQTKGGVQSQRSWLSSPQKTPLCHSQQLRRSLNSLCPLLLDRHLRDWVWQPSPTKGKRLYRQRSLSEETSLEPFGMSHPG